MPNRIREIRESKGWTLEYVARLYGGKATAKTIQRLEVEERKLQLQQAIALAKIFEVSVNEIAGETGVEVPVVGLVGAGEIVNSFDENEPLDWISPPGRPGAASTHAVRVQGDSMWPAYKPGDLLFYFPSDNVAPDAIGQDCVIRLRNGQMYVKTLKRGTGNGLFRLVSIRSATPDIEEVDVQWAAKIKWTERP